MLLTACQTFTQISLSFSESQVEAWTAKSFPIQKQDKLFTVILQNPKVFLSEGSDRIGIQVSIEGSLLQTPLLSAKGFIEGELLYKPEKRMLYLTHFSIQELSLSSRAGKEGSPSYNAKSLLGSPVTSLLQGELKEIPLYQLDARSLGKGPYSIKQVSVKNGRLVIVLSLL